MFRAIKEIIGFLLYGWGYIFNRRKLKVLSLYFHNPTSEAFGKIVLWLIKHNYSFISSETLLSYIRGEIKLVEKSVYISFDDGWRSNIELLPIIEKYNIPVTVFVASEPLCVGNYWWEFVNVYGGDTKVQEFKTYSEERFLDELSQIKSKVKLERSSMTTEDLRMISKHILIDIQAHTHSHPILTALSEESLDFELKYSQEIIASLTDGKIDKFSYPNGSYTQREKEFVQKYYECAFSTIQSYPLVGGDLYEIPRIALSNEYWSNLAKIVGSWSVITNLKMNGLKSINGS